MQIENKLIVEPKLKTQHQKNTSKYKYKHEKKTKTHNTQEKIDTKQMLLY